MFTNDHYFSHFLVYLFIVLRVTVEISRIDRRFTGTIDKVYKNQNGEKKRYPLKHVSRVNLECNRKGNTDIQMKRLSTKFMIFIKQEPKSGRERECTFEIVSNFVMIKLKVKRLRNHGLLLLSFLPIGTLANLEVSHLSVKHRK